MLIIAFYVVEKFGFTEREEFFGELEESDRTVEIENRLDEVGLVSSQIVGAFYLS